MKSEEGFSSSIKQLGGKVGDYIVWYYDDDCEIRDVTEIINISNNNVYIKSIYGDLKGVEQIVGFNTEWFAFTITIEHDIENLIGELL